MIYRFYSRKSYANLALYCSQLQQQIEDMTAEHQLDMHTLRMENYNERRLRDHYQRKAERLEKGSIPRSKGRFARNAPPCLLSALRTARHIYFLHGVNPAEIDELLKKHGG